MKKLKKFIYPIIFTICFFLSFMILAMVLNGVLSPGDYAGLAYAGIALVLWILFVIPIYCVKYCKLIRKEKLKFLFCFYNPLVISFSYTAPFIAGAGPSAYGVIFQIAVALFVWVAIWTFVPLVTQFVSTKEQDQDLDK